MLQANPELGEFRIHAALLQLGIRLSPRTCGRILALNRSLYKLPGPAAEPLLTLLAMCHWRPISRIYLFSLASMSLLLRRLALNTI